MVKVSIFGHFGEGKNLLNGQTVKTKIVTEELQEQLGNEQVLTIDTHGKWKTLLKSPLQVLKALKKSRNVLIFPAHNGVRVYAPLLSFGKRLFKNRKIHYVVIGGWLPEFLSERRWLEKRLKRFDGIYVETNTMKTALDNMGFQNVFVMPNCKRLQVLQEDALVYATTEPYKLCTFSRVTKQKGIEDAVNAVKTVNETLNRTVYTLDIYGQIDDGQAEWFTQLQEKFPSYVRYCGCVDADKSVDVLKEYFALLFPTRFYTEGIPGTIIDAYAAGVPVISARWESFCDIIDDGVTGIGYAFENVDELIATLLSIQKSANTLQALKGNCLKKSVCFSPKRCVITLIEQFS